MPHRTRIALARRKDAAKPKDEHSSKRGRRKNGLQTEAEIITSATPLFAKFGFDGVSTRMIAKAAGVSVPTIYLYFVDKRNLYLRCCVEVFGRGSDAMLKAIGESGTQEEKVFRGMQKLAEALTTDPNLGQLFQRELLSADTEGLNLLERAAFRESFELLDLTIEKALGAPPPELTTISIYALTFGLFQYMNVGNIIEHPVLKPERIAEWLARHVIRITLPSIYGRLFGRVP